jgi:hypothetical protein
MCCKCYPSSVISKYRRRVKLPLRPSVVSTATACASTEIIFLTVASVQIWRLLGLSLRFADALVVRSPSAANDGTMPIPIGFPEFISTLIGTFQEWSDEKVWKVESFLHRISRHLLQSSAYLSPTQLVQKHRLALFLSVCVL